MALPKLSFAEPGAPTTGITLVVYAPFGSDPALAFYDDGAKKAVAKHPLVKQLSLVAGMGVHVCALIDLLEDETHLVEWTAGNTKPTITSRWKLQMDTVPTLAGLLQHARKTRPRTALVLGLEGHGAGWLPELDRRLLSAEQVTGGGKYEWHLGRDKGRPVVAMGAPLLAMGAPLLPAGTPVLPVNHMPMSTWALGQALKLGLGLLSTPTPSASSGGRKLGVLHFNNCFNMAVEVLHTVAPAAEYATGYMNYNFFTAGEAYPLAFANFAKQGNVATTQQLAVWLAQANGTLLRRMTHHPTVGGAVRLDGLPGIAKAVDTLAKALIKPLKAAPDGAARRAVAERMRLAIRKSQQYDTHTPLSLDSPDELTDLFSLAEALTTFDLNGAAVVPIQKAARELMALLRGIKVYGENDSPYFAPSVRWDFRDRELAMNIFCPDPDLKGLWDWRSPYYLEVKAELARPAVQPRVIDFLKQTAWPEFIVQYHRETAFDALRPAGIPLYNRFDLNHKVP